VLIWIKKKGDYLLYSELVMDHFMIPRNIGVIEDADANIQVGDPKCATAPALSQNRDDVIIDVNYRFKGCPASIATSSMTTEMVKGLTWNRPGADDEQVAEAWRSAGRENSLFVTGRRCGACGILRYLSSSGENEHGMLP
jgi:nitrogen fixation NifU-like protein